jgi:hypothetical protein
MRRETRGRLRFWLLAFLGGGVLVLASAAPADATFPGRNGQLAGVGETVDGYPAIYAVTPDGLMTRRLVKWAPYFVEGVSYAPNGRRLTFMAFRGGHLSIWTIRADGSRLRRVVENAVVPEAGRGTAATSSMQTRPTRPTKPTGRCSGRARTAHTLFS